MHRSDRVWLASVFVLPLLLVLSVEPARAQGSEGDLGLTDIDPTTVLTDDVGEGNTHPPLDGGGEDLWQGGSLTFPADPDGSGGDGNQVYRSVAASLQAPLPECHGGTAEITVSVRVENNGPSAGVNFSGRFVLLEPGDPAAWPDRLYGETGPPASTPVDQPETLTLSATVPAEDLAAGDVFAVLALETYHSTDGESGNTGAEWTADQISATYAFDTAGCAPGIALEKTGSGPDPLGVGDTVEYSFVVSNPGDLTLTNVEVTDPLPGLSSIDCPGTELEPAAEMICTATYEVTQADVDAGAIENTATVSGESPAGGEPATDTSTTTLETSEPVPALPPLAFVLLAALLATATLWTLRQVRA